MAEVQAEGWVFPLAHNLDGQLGLAVLPEKGIDSLQHEGLCSGCSLRNLSMNSQLAVKLKVFFFQAVSAIQGHLGSSHGKS